MAKDIKNKFAAQLAGGKVIITDILETSNPNQKRIEVAQLVKGDAPNLIGILQKQNQGSTLVAWMPVLTSMVAEKKFKIGGELDGFLATELAGATTNIQVEESVKPFTWEDEDGKVRVNKNAKMRPGKDGAEGMYLTSGGNYIFRQTSLVTGSPNNVKVQHDDMIEEAPNYDILEASLQATAIAQ
jgi:hypothetical protein